MKKNNKTQCPVKEDLIASLIDNEGNAEQNETMQKHVQTCTVCSSMVYSFSNTSELLKNNRPEPVHLSPSFTAEVMDEVYGVEYKGLLDDIIILSRKVVTAGIMLVVILLAFMFIPEDAAIDVITMDEVLPVNNDVDGRIFEDVIEKEEITYDDVVSLTFTQR